MIETWAWDLSGNLAQPKVESDITCVVIHIGDSTGGGFPFLVI